MSQTRRHDTPVRYGSRYDSPDSTNGQGATDVRASRACPVCQATLASARARYCSDACKQRAYRLRQTDTVPVDLAALTADLRSRRALVAHTVYECPTCEARFLGDQRCPDCHVFCRRLGLGGLCPHCDGPVTLAELLDIEEVQR
jgi:hypothetical protein